MSAPRHRAAKHRAPRPSRSWRPFVTRPSLPGLPSALRTRRPPAVLAVSLAATAVLATGVSAAMPGGGGGDATAEPLRTALKADVPSLGERDAEPKVSRSTQRSTELLRAEIETAPLRTDDAAGGLAAAPGLQTEDRLWTTEDVTLSTGPGDDFATDGTVASGEKVAVTGTTDDGWSEVLVDDKPRWIETSLLSADEPGLSSAPCPTGSDVESGLMDATVAVHRAVCAEFPSVSTYGGMRSDGMHGRGQALDIMVSGATGDEIAAFVRENAAELGVTEVIWQQRIWTTQRASEGWRSMEDRGSVTANHFDHVHVTTGG